MRRLVALLVVGIAVVVVAILIADNGSNGRASTGELSAAYTCKVGHPASLNTPPIGAQPTTPRLIVGCGWSRSFGPLEIVAYNTSQAFCFSLDRPKTGSSLGGECKPATTKWSSFCPRSLCISTVEDIDGEPGGRYHSTFVSGVLSPDAKTVEIVSGAKKQKRSAKAVVANMSPEILRRLHQTEPFGLFALVLSDCIPPTEIHVVAIGEDGKVLGMGQGRHTFPHPCSV
jgi:hypothetical protein